MGITSRQGILFGSIFSSIFLWKKAGATFIVAAGGNHQPPHVNDSPAGHHETTHIVDKI